MVRGNRQIAASQFRGCGIVIEFRETVPLRGRDSSHGLNLAVAVGSVGPSYSEYAGRMPRMGFFPPS